MNVLNIVVCRGCLLRPRVIYINFFARPLFYSNQLRSKSNSSKLANTMSKVMNLSNKKRKPFNVSANSPSDGLKMAIEDPTHKRAIPRRVSVLNKLFMSYISEIIATGTFSSDLVGKGLEITGISVSREYNYMNVFWASGNSDNDEYLQKYLPEIAFSIRHDLSQLHLMGSVPRIVFVRDLGYSRLASIQHLLDKCDKGETDQEDLSATEEDVVPAMPMNVYGLKYDLMVSKLLHEVSKAKAPHRINTSDLIACPASVDNESDDLSIVNERDAIRKYLLQKKMDRKKYLKAKNHDDEEQLTQT